MLHDGVKLCPAGLKMCRKPMDGSFICASGTDYCCSATCPEGERGCAEYDVEGARLPKLVILDSNEQHIMIDFDAYEYDGVTAKTMTRMYNGGIPGPILRFHQDTIVELTLRNFLHENSEDDPAITNTYHHPNSTNLHTHGLHVSPLEPSDCIFCPAYPRSEKHHAYWIPPDHLGGTHWYHPHYHGSTALQVGGGASGMIIIPHQEEEGMPEDLKQMQEIPMVMTAIPVTNDNIAQIETLSHGNVITDFGEEDLLLLNGMYKPQITLVQGKWYRFRTVLSAANVYLDLAPSANLNCEMVLLARDGVWLFDGMRPVNYLRYVAGSRNDVAIRCQNGGESGTLNAITEENGSFGADSESDDGSDDDDDDDEDEESSDEDDDDEDEESSDEDDDDEDEESSDEDDNDEDDESSDEDANGDVEEDIEFTEGSGVYGDQAGASVAFPDQAVATILVIACGEEMCGSEPLTEWTPNMPHYLSDLRNADDEVKGSFEIEFGGDDGNCNINDEVWTNPPTPIFEMVQDSVYEWIVDSDDHPLHAHINHFQIMETTDDWNIRGDWVDVYLSEGPMRVRTDKFLGYVVMHCHWLTHEDNGCMGVAEIVAADGYSAKDNNRMAPMSLNDIYVPTPTTGGEAYVMHDGPCAMYTPSEDECAADSTLVYSMSGTPEECAQECEERADCKQLTITMQDKETAWCWLLSSEYMAGEMDKWQYVQRPVTAEAGMTCCLSSASEHMKMSSCTENGCMITQEIGYFPGGSASIKLMANLANEGEMAAVYVNNKYAAMCTEASCGEYTECSTPSLEEMEKLTISVMSMPTASTCGDSALSVETTLMYGGDMSDDDDESESADTPDTDESESADTPDTDESDESTDTDESSESAEEDPCSCSGSMGWSSETESCQEGSTTSCDECPTMSGCDSSTCAEASCPMEYDAMRLCQCTANCAEYGNCCADASTCLEAESDSDESAEPMSCTTNSDCPNYKLYPSADGGWCDGGVCSTCDAEGFLECYTYDFPNGFDYNAMDSCVQACACDLEFLGSESKSPPVTTDGVPNGMVYKWADATRLPEECQGVCFGPGCYDKVSDSCCSSGEFGGAEVFADLSSTFANGETCVSVSFGSETVMLAGGCGTSGKFFYGEQCGGSTFGPFAGIGADSVCYQPDTDCRCNAYVETTEAGCYRVGSIPAMPGMPQELYFLDVVDPVCRDRGTPDNGGDGGDSGDDYEDCYEVWQLESRCNGDYEVYEDQTPASCLIEAATRGYTYFSHHSGNNKCRVWMTDNCDNPRGANAAWTTYRSIC